MWSIFSHDFFRYFFCPVLFLLAFWDTNKMKIRYFVIDPWVSKALFIFFLLFTLGTFHFSVFEVTDSFPPPFCCWAFCWGFWVFIFYFGFCSSLLYFSNLKFPFKSKDYLDLCFFAETFCFFHLWQACSEWLTDDCVKFLHQIILRSFLSALASFVFFSFSLISSWFLVCDFFIGTWTLDIILWDSGSYLNILFQHLSWQGNRGVEMGAPCFWEVEAKIHVPSLFPLTPKGDVSHFFEQGWKFSSTMGRDREPHYYLSRLKVLTSCLAFFWYHPSNGMGYPITNHLEKVEV